MTKNITLIGLGTLLILLSSCATIGNYTLQNQNEITIRQAGIDIYVDDSFKGKSPVKIKVQPSLKKQYLKYVYTDRQRSQIFELEKNINPLFYLNIVVPIGFLIDVLTGYMYSVEYAD